MFVKIRLLDSMEDSIELVEGLVSAGAALVAIHARYFLLLHLAGHYVLSSFLFHNGAFFFLCRYRVNLVGRSGPGARDGAAKLDQVAVIKEHMRRGQYAHVPIVANGVTYQTLNLKTNKNVMSQRNNV